MGIDWTKTYLSLIGRLVYIANAVDDTIGESLEELV